MNLKKKRAENAHLSPPAGEFCFLRVIWLGIHKRGFGPEELRSAHACRVLSVQLGKQERKTVTARRTLERHSLPKHAETRVWELEASRRRRRISRKSTTNWRQTTETEQQCVKWTDLSEGRGPRGSDPGPMVQTKSKGRVQFGKRDAKCSVASVAAPPLRVLLLPPPPSDFHMRSCGRTATSTGRSD